MFNEIFKELRVEKGITQAELAKHLNHATSLISSWEIGHREPTLSGLIKIAEYFGVTVDYLLGRGSVEEYINYHSQQEQELLSLFVELDGYRRSEVLGFVRGLARSQQRISK